MNIFFDVDYTLLGGRDLTLRPGTLEVFQRLRADGHEVYVWSGEGERWEFVRRHGLEDLVSGVFGKPLHDYRNRLSEFGVPVVPDFVIDDYPGIVRCFGGMYIREYFGAPYHRGSGEGGLDAPEDDELQVVYDLITALASGDLPTHARDYSAEG